MTPEDQPYIEPYKPALIRSTLYPTSTSSSSRQIAPRWTNDTGLYDPILPYGDMPPFPAPARRQWGIYLAEFHPPFGIPGLPGVVSYDTGGLGGWGHTRNGTANQVLTIPTTYTTVAAIGTTVSLNHVAGVRALPLDLTTDADDYRSADAGLTPKVGEYGTYRWTSGHVVRNRGPASTGGSALQAFDLEIFNFAPKVVLAAYEALFGDDEVKTVTLTGDFEYTASSGRPAVRLLKVTDSLGDQNWARISSFDGVLSTLTMSRKND